MTTIVRSRRRNQQDVLVCAVATHETRGLRMLLESCKRFGIGLTLFGWGERYESHRWKLLTQRAALRQLAGEHELVLFLDAFDTVFTAGLDEVLAKFRALGAPVLMSAEVNCHPPEGPRPHEYPPAPTRYAHVNSGGYVGEMRALLEIFDRFDRPGYSDQPEDQGFWAKVYVSGQAPMKLDHGNEVFQCLWLADEDIERGRRLRNRATGSRPAIVHGNGFCDMDPYYRMLLRHRYWKVRAAEALKRGWRRRAH